MNTTDSSESDITEIAQYKLPSKIKDESSVSLGEVSRSSPANLNEAISDSMNYADNCLSEIISRMEEVGSDASASSVEKLLNVAGSARALAEVLKAKVEAMKLIRE